MWIIIFISFSFDLYNLIKICFYFIEFYLAWENKNDINTFKFKNKATNKQNCNLNWKEEEDEENFSENTYTHTQTNTK